MPAYVVVTPSSTSNAESSRKVERLLARYEAQRLPAPEGAGTGPTFVTYAVSDMTRATELADALRGLGLEAFPKPGEALP